MTWKTLLAAALAAASAVGQSPTLPAGLQPGDPYRILFVTRFERDANPRNISVYDSFVAADVAASPPLAALNTNWRVVASTGNVDARDHIDVGDCGVPIYRPDGVLLADDHTHLWQSTNRPLHATPNITGLGTPAAPGTPWTGTANNGTAHFGSLGGGFVRRGVLDSTTNWLGGSQQPASWSAPFFGISDVLTVPYPEYPAGLEAGDEFRILFVTTATTTASSGNISTYDAIVQAEAAASPLLAQYLTNWRAVASTVSGQGVVAARWHTETNTPGGVPIYRPDRVRIADDYDHLWGTFNGPQLLAPPNITSAGTPTTAPLVWTGTKHDGTAIAPFGASQVTFGNPLVQHNGWMQALYYPNSVTLPIYGISDPIIIPAREPGHPQDLGPGDQYRVLLVTDRQRDGSSTAIADYDAFVAADAYRAAKLRVLRTDWSALASTPSVDARDHTGTAGGGGDVPIYRPDGVRVADDYGHLWGTSGGAPLLAAPNVTARGHVTTATRIWTGTGSSGLAQEPLGDGSGSATTGSPTVTHTGWASSTSLAQSGQNPLYGLSAVITIPFGDRVGTGCGSASLSRNSKAILGGSFDSTMAGVPATAIGAVLVDLNVPTAGTPQPTPPFAPGCTLYLSATMTLGLVLQPSQAFSIAIPSNPAYVGLPIAQQGALLDLTSGEVTLTNAIAVRVTDC